MARGRILTGIWTVMLLSFALPAAKAQESFLQQFQSVSRSESAEKGFTPLFVSAEGEVNPLESADNSTKESESQEASSVQTTGYQASITCGDDVCQDDECSATSACDIPLVRFRKSCFQGAQASYGTLNDNPDLGIKIRTLETSATFAIPLGSMENVITFTPYIRADLLEAAAVFDVPESLFDTGIKMFWKRPISDRLGSILLITPSIRSDFTTRDNAFRLFGMGLLTWQWVPQKLSVSGGVVYTGRDDFPILPAMGLLWTPSPEWKFDAQFPSPRISRRLTKNGACSETWAYLSGVFGGNTWAVTRAGGATDQLTISDLRLVTGIEYVQCENRGFFLEAGYVFNRSMEYTNVPFQRDLDAAMMMRAGVTF